MKCPALYMTIPPHDRYSLCCICAHVWPSLALLNFYITKFTLLRCVFEDSSRDCPEFLQQPRPQERAAENAFDVHYVDLPAYIHTHQPHDAARQLLRLLCAYLPRPPPRPRG
ncbi:hypothetical protein G3M48_009904 [Beauveria asiatica]|uniref:Uncharacterized protein n=1 Tax=Beauveria asiatica TaxID=1069075 RepID=A0AAW0S2K5_9HYPO